MPGTAAAYGLDDPFDPVAAIDAQAHLMSDLLRQFGSPRSPSPPTTPAPAPVEACGCVPPTPRPRPTSARILALLGGAGARWRLPASRCGWWRDADKGLHQGV